MKKVFMFKKLSMLLVFSILIIMICACSEKTISYQNSTIIASENSTAGIILANNGSEVLENNYKQQSISEFVNDNFYKLIKQTDIINLEDKRYSEFIDKKGGVANSVQTDNLTFYWMSTGFSTIILLTNYENGKETIIYKNIEYENIVAVSGYKTSIISGESDECYFFKYESYLGTGSNMSLFTTILCTYQGTTNIAYHDQSISYETNNEITEKYVRANILTIQPFDKPYLLVASIDTNTSTSLESEIYQFVEKSRTFEK